MVLFGELVPGQSVTIQGLVEQLDAGITPVREAIRRLTAEGALEAMGNRRIAVPKLSLAQLDEIMFLRQVVEPHLAAEAARLANPVDIDALASRDARLNRAIASGDVRGYLEHNYEFHRTLYDLAQRPIIHAVAEGLWLRVGPALRIVCGQRGTSNLPDKHEEALEALRNRDAQAAAAAIADDIEQGASNIRQSLSEATETRSSLTV